MNGWKTSFGSLVPASNGLKESKSPSLPRGPKFEIDRAPNESQALDCCGPRLGMLVAAVVPVAPAPSSTTGRPSRPAVLLESQLARTPNIERDAIPAAVLRRWEPILTALNTHSWRDWNFGSVFDRWFLPPCTLIFPHPGIESRNGMQRFWMLGELSSCQQRDTRAPSNRCDRSAADKRAAAIMALARSTREGVRPYPAISLLSSTQQTERSGTAI